MVKKVVLALFALSVVSGGILTANAENVGMEHNAQSEIPSRFARAEKPYALVGNPAPDFKLEGVVGTDPGKEFRTLTLKDYKDKWLVLFFYPADFTFVCPTEIKGFNDSIDSFKKLNAEVAAVSTDSKWSHLAWIKRGDLGSLKYPLL